MNQSKASTVLSLDAMLIRASEACSLVKGKQLDGIDALCMIVEPGEELLEASLSVARERGPTKLAVSLAASLANEPLRRGRPRVQLPRQISLDDLLLAL